MLTTRPAHTTSAGRTVVEAALVCVLSVVVALLFNTLRSGGLPLVATVPYQTMVPCPEPGGPVGALDADHPEIHSPATLLVDARPQHHFDERHLQGAMYIPFDWLDPIPEQDLEAMAHAIAASGAKRVVVYGDGGRPDSGEHLGREISARGIKNVWFIRGGAAAAFAAEEQ